MPCNSMQGVRLSCVRSCRGRVQGTTRDRIRLWDRPAQPGWSSKQLGPIESSPAETARSVAEGVGHTTRPDPWDEKAIPRVARAAIAVRAEPAERCSRTEHSPAQARADAERARDLKASPNERRA